MTETTTSPAISGQIRWMIRRDMPQVLAIENESFQFPWSEEDFLNCLRQRNCICMVFDRIGSPTVMSAEIAGFMVYELYRTKLWLLNLAVLHTNRREGVGTAMLAKLKNKLSQQRWTEIGMHIRESNLSGQLFLRRCGFRAASVIRNHYRETTEDAYVMQYRLPAEISNEGERCARDVH